MSAGKLKGRVRRRPPSSDRGTDEAFQFIAFDEGGQVVKRGAWVKGEDTAKEQLKKYLDGHSDSSKSSGSESGASTKNQETPDEPLRRQGASDVPPGGQNTGPR
ncbi:MAG TPA: hypothetical protein VJ777_07110 [Mycobacterium sp.]|nr:hypothetical protein [Mycobacterium sp.]